MHAGKFYIWATSFIPFIPQAYDERDGDEDSESNRFVAAGQAIVNRAMSDLQQGSAVSSDYLNAARYSPGNGPRRGAIRLVCNVSAACACVALVIYGRCHVCEIRDFPMRAGRNECSCAVHRIDVRVRSRY